MLNRLANVVFWACCVFSTIFAVMVIVGLIFGSGSDRWVAVIGTGVASVLFYLFGRGFRYVVSGR